MRFVWSKAKAALPSNPFHLVHPRQSTKMAINQNPEAEEPNETQLNDKFDGASYTEDDDRNADYDE
jgi:hypothetical protein